MITRGGLGRRRAIGIVQWLLICGTALASPVKAQAWEPNKADLQTALNTGSFGAYYSRLSMWLSTGVQVAGGTTEAALSPLLKDPVFLNALAQRQFLSKAGVATIEAGAKTSAEDRTFLAWLLQNTAAMTLCIEGATPVGLKQREAEAYNIPADALRIWSRIYHADPESHEGLYLRLAIATGLNPPGTSTPGSGQSKKPLDPLERYYHFKKAHRNGDLFPTFETLTVWDLRQVVCSNASDEDLAWGRQMVRTWMPQLLTGEKVVETTSYVWRRNSPIPHNNYRDVLDGGGKCGPRSSWSVFICQAFGIPATGVGQPAHACVAYRAMDGAWQVAYGRSWAASRLLGLSGNEFVEGIKVRSRAAQFSMAEHLRWLASATASPAVADGLRSLARQIDLAPDPLGRLPLDRKPDATSVLTTFEAPSNVGNFYDARVRGFVHPPQTGEYAFFTASDDESDLYLSTDESPQNRKLVAIVRGWSGPRDFDGSPAQKSAPVKLVAGKRYYIESVHRELDGPDHLAVGWSGPGVTKGVIPGACLSPYPSGAKGSIRREVWQVPPVAPKPPPPPAANPEPPIKVAAGVIHLEAEAFFNQGGITVWGGYPGVPVFDCYTGGKQVLFQGCVATAWAGYKIGVPATGVYELTARVAAPNSGQGLYVRSFGAMLPVKGATASHVYRNNVAGLGPQFATDNDPGTRWCVNENNDQCWLEMDLGKPTKISTVMIDERAWNRVSKFNLAYKANNDWKVIFEGTNIGIDFSKDFDPVTARHVRLNIFDSREGMGYGPTIWEFSLGTVKDGRAWIALPRTDGLWQTTKPVDISLVKGEQTLWVIAPFQRGVAARWFELKPKVSGALVESAAPIKALSENAVEDAE